MTKNHAEKSATNFIDPKELHSLPSLSPDELHEKLMFWFKNFICSEKNQVFRDRVGLAIFNRPSFLICCLSVSQKEEVLVAFKNFNPKPAKKLEEQINWVNLNYDQIRIKKIKYFAETAKSIRQLNEVE